MRKTFVTAALITLALGACTKHTRTLPVENPDPKIPTCYPLSASIPCEPNIICTAVYADIQVTVKDSKGNDVVLDSYYTIDATGSKMPSDLYSYQLGGAGYSSYYIIFNDYWMSGHKNTVTPIRFIGYKNGIKVVDEPYTVNADCCHISKAAGKDQIIIP